MIITDGSATRSLVSSSLPDGSTACTPEDASLGTMRRQICTFFAMGGCNRGDRCPYSHELTQEAPEGVDVTGGFFISGKVANYRASVSPTGATPPQAAKGLNPSAKAFHMPSSGSSSGSPTGSLCTLSDASRLSDSVVAAKSTPVPTLYADRCVIASSSANMEFYKSPSSHAEATAVPQCSNTDTSSGSAPPAYGLSASASLLSVGSSSSLLRVSTPTAAAAPRQDQQQQPRFMFPQAYLHMEERRQVVATPPPPPQQPLQQQQQPQLQRVMVGSHPNTAGVPIPRSNIVRAAVPAPVRPPAYAPSNTLVSSSAAGQGQGLSPPGYPSMRQAPSSPFVMAPSAVTTPIALVPLTATDSGMLLIDGGVFRSIQQHPIFQTIHFAR